MEHSLDLGIQKYQNEIKSLEELGHTDCLKIYFDHSKNYVPSGILLYSNDLSHETTVTLVLKYSILHDQTARLRNGRIHSCQISKMAALTKISKTTKIKFCMEHMWDLVLRNVKMKNLYSRIRSQ